MCEAKGFSNAKPRPEEPRQSMATTLNPLEAIYAMRSSQGPRKLLVISCKSAWLDSTLPSLIAAARGVRGCVCRCAGAGVGEG